MDRKQNSGLFEAPEPIFSVEESTDIVHVPEGTEDISQAPTIAIYLAWGNSSHDPGLNTISANLYARALVTGVDSTDIVVVNPSGQIQTGWAIVLSQTGVSLPDIPDSLDLLRNISVTATQSTFTAGVYRLSVQAGTMRSESTNVPLISRTSTSFEKIQEFHAVWQFINAGQTISGMLRFSYDFTGLSGSDIQVLNSNDVVQSNWIITVSSSSGNAGQNITVVATPPTNTRGEFKLRIPSNTVNRGGGTNNSPDRPEDTVIISVNNTSSILPISLTWSDIQVPSNNSAVITGTLTTTGRINRVAERNFFGIVFNRLISIVDASNIVQTGWRITVSEARISPGLRSDAYWMDPDSPLLFHAVGPQNTVGDFKFRYNGAGQIGSRHLSLPTILPIDSDLVSINAIGVPRFRQSGNRIFLEFIGPFSGTLGWTNSDIEVINLSGTAQTGWTISTHRSSLNGEFRSTEIIGIPPSGQIGNFFRFRIPANTFISGSVMTPTTAVTSPVFASGGGSVARWLTSSGGNILEGSLQWDPIIPHSLTSNAFEVLNENNVVQTGWFIFSSNNNIQAWPPVNTNALYKLRLKAMEHLAGPENILSPGENTDAELHLVNNTGSLDLPSISWSNIVGGARLSGRLNPIGSGISSVQATDIEILNSSNIVQSDWTITVSNSEAFNRSFITVTGTPTSTTPFTGLFKFRLKSNSVRSPGSTTDNIPSSAILSQEILINTYDPIEVSSFTAPTGTQIGPTSTFVITFNLAIPKTELTISDFVRTDPSDTGITINSVTGRGTGTTATIFDIVSTNPENRQGSYSITLLRNSISHGMIYFEGPDLNSISEAVSYSRLPLRASWGTASFCGTSNTLTTQLIFSESITDTTLTEFDIITLNQNGIVLLPNWSHTITGSGSSYTVTSIPSANTNGIFKLRLLANSVTFQINRTGPVENVDSSEFNVDNRIAGGDEVAIFWSNLTGGITLGGRLTFTGQDFTGIAPADFEVLLAATGIADTRFTIMTSATNVKAGQYITITATPSSTLNIDTDYQLRLKMDSVRSGTSTSDNSPSVNIDSNNIHLSTLISWGTPTGGSTLRATMTFRGSIERIDLTDYDVFDQTDVVQSGWTIAFSPTGITSRTNGQTLDIIATPPALTNNIFRIRLRRQTMRLGSSGADTVPTRDLISSGALVNNIVTPVIPMVPSEAFWSDLTGGTSLSGRITFPGNAIASITASDFDVILALTGVAETRFTITVNSATAKQGQYVMVTATPASTLRIDTDYQLRLKANSVRADGSATDNFPTANIDSNNIHLNTIVVWGTPTGGTTLTATMTFRSEITRIGIEDFDILDQADVVQSNWTIAFSPTGTTSRQENETLDIIATPPSNTNDIFRIRLRRHTMRLGTSGSADTVPTDDTITSGALVNNIVIPDIPMVSSGAFWSELIGGTSLSGNITFPENAVASIEPADFEVILAATGIASRQFTITTSSTSAKHGQYVTVTATPSSGLNVDTNFQLRLKADSTRADGSMADNFPEVNIDSNDVHLSTILSWGDPSGGTTLEVPLNFRSDIDDIGPDDFEVLDSLNEITTGWTITLNPNVSSRDSGESLTVIGTPPDNTDDAFRLRVKSNSMRFDISTENHIPIVDITSRAARVNNFPIDMSVDPPYILATVPSGTSDAENPFKSVQTPTNNPSRTITLTITSEVAGTLTNIDNLRNTDFIISSPEGNIVPTLT